MQTGTVKLYHNDKGWGFIKPDGGGWDIFVHKSALARSGINHLATGDRVTFDAEISNRTGKPAATGIKLEEKAA